MYGDMPIAGITLAWATSLLGYMSVLTIHAVGDVVPAYDMSTTFGLGSSCVDPLGGDVGVSRDLTCVTSDSFEGIWSPAGYDHLLKDDLFWPTVMAVEYWSINNYAKDGT